MPKMLTTGQAARMCGHAPRTICSWFDQGLFEGYRMPHSGDRRIDGNSFRAFARVNDIPITELEAGRASRKTRSNHKSRRKAARSR